MVRRAAFAIVCVALIAAPHSSHAGDVGAGWEEKKKDGKVVQELKIEAPAVTEEDQYGYVMPERYRCDACKAVLFHLETDLKKKQKSRRMKQWEYTELFDDTCKTSFTGYGVKLVNGENALSGPGLKAQEELAPGSGAIQMGGDAWNKRLGEICRKLVYEDVGEDELYDKFHAGGSLPQSLCNATRHCKPTNPKPRSSKDTAEAKSGIPADKPKPPRKEKPNKFSNTGASDSQTVQATVSSQGPDQIDVQTYLRALAVQHGLPAEEYLRARTKPEWEKLTVSMASRIFGKAEL